MTPGIIEWKTGAPGWTSWTSTSAAMISASPCARLPAIAAGPVVPQFAIDMIPTGTPAVANTSAASSASASWASGEMAQISDDSGGRARMASSDPPITRAISTA